MCSCFYVFLEEKWDVFVFFLGFGKVVWRFLKVIKSVVVKVDLFDGIVFFLNYIICLVKILYRCFWFCYVILIFYEVRRLCDKNGNFFYVFLRLLCI